MLFHCATRSQVLCNHLSHLCLVSPTHGTQLLSIPCVYSSYLNPRLRLSICLIAMCLAFLSCRFSDGFTCVLIYFCVPQPRLPELPICRFGFSVLCSVSSVWTWLGLSFTVLDYLLHRSSLEPNSTLYCDHKLPHRLNSCFAVYRSSSVQLALAK